MTSPKKGGIFGAIDELGGVSEQGSGEHEQGHGELLQMAAKTATS